ncbi:hypothetical protein FJY71_04245, partial [candidate division WOR-3 bacterium]|nr:hypothetical protein [candidate division WOR-3 bacterium]
MKWRSPFSMALLAIIAVPAVLTAYPRMTLFVPDNLADVGGWRLTITSDSAYEDVSLAGWIRADNQLVYDCTTHTFDVSPG